MCRLKIGGSPLRLASSIQAASTFSMHVDAREGILERTLLAFGFGLIPSQVSFTVGSLKVLWNLILSQ
jgi:hypothetical protein